MQVPAAAEPPPQSESSVTSDRHTSPPTFFDSFRPRCYWLLKTHLQEQEYNCRRHPPETLSGWRLCLHWVGWLVPMCLLVTPAGGQIPGRHTNGKPSFKTRPMRIADLPTQLSQAAPPIGTSTNQPSMTGTSGLLLGIAACAPYSAAPRQGEIQPSWFLGLPPDLPSRLITRRHYRNKMLLESQETDMPSFDTTHQIMAPG